MAFLVECTRGCEDDLIWECSIVLFEASSFLLSHLSSCGKVRSSTSASGLICSVLFFQRPVHRLLSIAVASEATEAEVE